MRCRVPDQITALLQLVSCFSCWGYTSVASKPGSLTFLVLHAYSPNLYNENERVGWRREREGERERERERERARENLIQGHWDLIFCTQWRPTDVLGLADTE